MNSSSFFRSLIHFTCGGSTLSYWGIELASACPFVFGRHCSDNPAWPPGTAGERRSLTSLLPLHLSPLINKVREGFPVTHPKLPLTTRKRALVSSTSAVSRHHPPFHLSEKSCRILKIFRVETTFAILCDDTVFFVKNITVSHPMGLPLMAAAKGHTMLQRATKGGQ